MLQRDTTLEVMFSSSLPAYFVQALPVQHDEAGEHLEVLLVHEFGSEGEVEGEGRVARNLLALVRSQEVECLQEGLWARRLWSTWLLRMWRLLGGRGLGQQW